MSDLLKSVIQDLINDRTEQAQVSIHDYIVGKTQQIAGLTEADDDDSIFTPDIIDAVSKVLNAAGAKFEVDQDSEELKIILHRELDDDDVEKDFTDALYDAEDAAIKAGAKDTEIDSEDGEMMLIIALR